MKVNLDFAGNIGFNIHARHFSLMSDEPPEFGGDDRGISSVELLLAAVGSCAGTSFAHCLKKLDIKPEDIRVEVDGKLTHPAPGEPLRVVSMKVAVSYKIKPGYDPEILETCVDKFKQYCVVTQSVIGGIPAVVEVSQLRKP
jgi:putative redox protein